nr:hypothetical protein [Mycoplasmopsis bovis]
MYTKNINKKKKKLPVEKGGLERLLMGFSKHRKANIEVDIKS